MGGNLKWGDEWITNDIKWTLIYPILIIERGKKRSKRIINLETQKDRVIIRIANKKCKWNRRCIRSYNSLFKGYQKRSYFYSK